MTTAKGQITVFIALIFQVLFVFFAMFINVGMTVHDKINLQNSIDIATYYGAQKQAEVLNVIAHVNYQIRQDWKLLAWRLRVLGDSSRSGHPSSETTTTGFSFNQPDQAWPGALRADASGGVALCMTNNKWNFQQSASNENVCADGGATNIPNIPELALPPIFPWNVLATKLIDDLRGDFSSTCKGLGLYNWAMAIRWMAAYRSQVAIRQDFINEMAKRLENFEDIEGNSIEEGMRRTLRANLTRANLESLDSEGGGASFEVFNSMEGLDTKDWLPNSTVFPIIFYTHLDSAGENACTGDNRHLREPADAPEAANILSEFGQFIFEPEIGTQNEIYHSTRGRQKNPWYMVYVGAKVSTRPRKPFFPFGDPIELVARSFAKPFGGRIGPWNKQFWLRQPGLVQEGEDIDPLMPDYFVERDGAQTGLNSVPNFSRFPGDELGLTSSPTLALLNTEVSNNKQDLNVDFYSHLPAQALYTPLAFRQNNPNSLWLRRFELAGIAPDIFDITYYSIQPNFYDSYLSRIIDSLEDPELLPLDHGSLPDQPMTVKRQIEVANEFRGFREAYFKVSDWEHLLNSWVANDTIDYSFPVEKFGECFAEPPYVPTDSDCIAGGRAGYSVKTISKTYLNSAEHALGGNPENQAPLLNPPGDF